MYPIKPMTEIVADTKDAAFGATEGPQPPWTTLRRFLFHAGNRSLDRPVTIAIAFADDRWPIERRA